MTQQPIRIDRDASVPAGDARPRGVTAVTGLAEDPPAAGPPFLALLEGEAWMASARCRLMPPSVFFPVDLTGVVQAKRICATCAVSHSCLEYALENNLEHGVWGGTSERARRKMRRIRRAPAA